MRKSALWGLGLVVTMLVALGLIVLSTAGEQNAFKLHGGDSYFFMKRQFAYVVIGIAVAAVTAFFDYRNWKKHWYLAIIFAVAVLMMLCGVLAFGRVINGSRRWLEFGPVRLQPSEFAKLATVIAVAVWMDISAWKVELFKRGVLVPVLIIAVLSLPVLKQPDFGSVMVIGAAGLLVMLVAGTNFAYWLMCVGGAIGIVAAKVLSNANRMARIAAWLGIKINIGAEVMDAAAERAMYQAKMALVAIKNGGLFGVGLGESMQKQYYLPEAHTDFIFAIGAEEMGLVFSIGVIVLFLLFFALCVYIARKAGDRLGRFLVIGMGFIIFFQAMFNLGVVCGALPTKGMALPFFSYGGTNMISSFFAVGTILSVGIHTLRDAVRSPRRG